MKRNKQAQTVLIRDPRAVAIVNERAQKENRSCSNCASVIIFESVKKKLNNKRDPGQPAFLDNVVVKDNDGESGSQGGKIE